MPMTEKELLKEGNRNMANAEYDEALEKYDQAIQLDPKYISAYINKGLVFKMIKKYEEAIECYDKAIELNPLDSIAYFYKGIILDSMKNYEEAIKCYDKAIELNPSDSNTYYHKGTVLFSLQKYDEAIECYDKAIELNPKYSNAYYSKGLSFENKKSYENALECFNKAIELNPTYSNSYYNKGNVLDNMEKYREAIQCYNKAIELNPKYRAAYINKGLALRNIQRYEDAIKCYDKAIKLNPKDTFAYFNKGIVLENLGKYEEAIKCYDKVMDLKPTDSKVFNNKGVVLEKLQRYDEAIFYYDKVIQFNPKESRGYYNKGIVYITIEQYEEAIKWFDKALELNPTDSDAYNNKGIVLENLKKYEEAIGCFDRAIEFNQSYQDAYYNKGVILKSLQKYEEAIKCYDRAIELGLENPLFYFNRGSLYYCLWKYPEALEDFEKASALVSNIRKSGSPLKDNLSQTQEKRIKDIRDVISHIVKLEKDVIEMEILVQGAENSHPVVTAFVGKLRNNREVQKSLMNEVFVFFEQNTQESAKDLGLIEKFDQQEAINQQLLEEGSKLTDTIIKYHQDQLDAAIHDAKYEFEILRERSSRLYSYCKSFYWTLLHYLNIYRCLKAELARGNKEALSKKDPIISKSIKTMNKAGSAMAEPVPFSGIIWSGIDSIVEDVYEFVTEETRLNIIAKYIIEPKDKDEEFAVKVAKASVEITKAKCKEILIKSPENFKTQDSLKLEPGTPSASENSSNDKGMKWIEDKVNEMIEDLNQRAAYVTNLYDCRAKVLALQDITLLMSYIYGKKESIPAGLPMEEMIKVIFTSGCLAKALNDTAVKEEELEQARDRIISPEDIRIMKDRVTKCCQIF